LREDRVAGLLAAEALAGAAPALFVEEPGELGVASVLARGFPLGDDVVRFVTRDQQRLGKPSGAHEHAELLITTRLRDKAAAIRSGHEPCILPSPPPEPTPHRRRRAERNVLFLQPVRYTNRFGQAVLHDAWAARVPAIVAVAAIKRGVAIDADTDAAREKMATMAELRRRTSARMPAVTVEDTIDLGVNLAEEIEPLGFSGAA
jgi:hypothetical protein